jgi:uncharacterized protein (DUF2062 family)
MLGQMLLGMGLSWLLRGNVIAAIPWTWITNPFTTPFIWFGCYRLGAQLCPGHHALGWDEMRGIAERFSDMGFREAVGNGWQLVGSIYLPLLLGSVLVGLATGVVGYVLIRWGVTRLQARRAQRTAHWRTRLAPPGPPHTT